MTLSSTGLSTGGGAFGAVDAVFDLSGRRGDLFGRYAALGKEDREAFLQITASLLKQGIVGTETLRVDGRPYQTDVTTRLGDERLRRAPAYRDGTGRNLDLRG